MSLCKNFGRKVKALLRKVDAELERLGPVVLKITGGIKKALEGPAGDLLTMIIPGDLDNHLRENLVKHLTTAIDYLNIIDTCKDKTGEEKVKCFIEELKKKSPKVRESLLIKLASIITSLMHSGNLRQNEYDTFIQLQYSLSKPDNTGHL